MSRTYGDPPHYYETVIDGESWVVRRGAKPGLYFFEWTSGPNSGYGFTSQSSDGSAVSTDDMDRHIRDVLADVDPETGHLRED
jgi:hypothetical protein